MTRVEFIQLLFQHDWHHQMSDDPGVYKKGRMELSEIRSICSKNPEFQKLYDEADGFIFYGENQPSWWG